MFDITNIPQRRIRTREVKDASGQRVRTKEEYWGVRPVKVITGSERFSHFFVDALIVSVLSNMVTLLLGLFSGAQVAFSLGVAVAVMLTPSGWLIAFAYYAFFEWRLGTTPGKMLFGRVVLTRKGEAPDVQTTLIRSLIRFIPFEAFSCFSDRGWHDRWSDTFVVSKEERDAIVKALAHAHQKAAEFQAQQH
jgi:uncharacterized RDD family membrane protein YckC